MKFLHTADWQIGMKSLQTGAASARVREERLSAAARTVEIANTHGAEFMLVAGDTFEDNAVDRLLVRKTAEILAKFRGPVYLISGNHDPLVPGSVWDHHVWSSHENLHVLREDAPLAIAGGVLYPSPLKEKYSTRNPVRWIDARERPEISIGIGHGTFPEIGGEQDYPIPRDAAHAAGLDYLAIGHWHSFFPIAGPDGVVRLAYSGTHETTKFGERDSGNALLVEIASRGAVPKITPIRTGGLQWLTMPMEIAASAELIGLREKLEKMSDPERTLLELKLGGIVSPSDEEILDRITETVHSRFLFARIDASGLLPAPDDTRWIEELPPGPLRMTAERLRGMLAGEQRETAAQAILRLYRMVRESGAGEAALSRSAAGK